MASVQVTGLDDMRRALEELTTDLRRKVIRGALRDAAKAPLREAVANSPFRHGVLRRNIFIGNSKIYTGRGGPLGVFVGVRKRKRRRIKGTRVQVTWGDDAYYAKFLEVGTAKMRAEPFLKPAGQATARESIAIFQRRIAERIAKANQRKPSR